MSLGGRWVRWSLAAGIVLFFLATASVVVLERQIFVWGPLSTLGLTPFLYLASIWCLSAAVLGRSSGDEGLLVQSLGVVTRGVVVVVWAVATLVLGTVARESASTPLHRVSPPGGQTEYLMRVGDPFQADSLSVYRGSGRRFELVVHTGTATVDARRFAEEFRLDLSDDVTPVLVYPDRGGGRARVDLR